MALYRLGRFHLQSNVQFSELTPVHASAADICFCYHPDSFNDKQPYQWLHHWYSLNNMPVLSFAKTATHYVMRAHDVADFWLGAEKMEISCFGRASVPLNTIRHLVLDQIIPFLLHANGYAVFHAGAVQWHGKAIGFLGDAGSGKSTLVAFLSQRGLKLITDDCLHLEASDAGVVCRPYYQNLRLWPDSFVHFASPLSEAPRVSHFNSKKRVLSREPFDYAPVPLDTLFVFSIETDRHSGGIKIEPISPRDALMALTRYTFRMDVTDIEGIKRDLDEAARLVEQIRFFSLCFPRQWDQLARVQESIIAFI